MVRCCIWLSSFVSPIGCLVATTLRPRYQPVFRCSCPSHWACAQRPHCVCQPTGCAISPRQISQQHCGGSRPWQHLRKPPCERDAFGQRSMPTDQCLWRVGSLFLSMHSWPHSTNCTGRCRPRVASTTCHRCSMWWSMQWPVDVSTTSAGGRLRLANRVAPTTARLRAHFAR